MALSRNGRVLEPVRRSPHVFELRGQIPPGWVALRIELHGANVHVPPRLLIGQDVHDLPHARRGRIDALLEVASNDVLELEMPSGSQVQLGRILIRRVARAEVALRRAAPVVWRRLREPRTIPAAVGKILRAAWSGQLVDRLLRRSDADGRQAFYPEWYAR